ncbi:MAG: hypothetical protein JWN70_6905, partial [Planctomycetaceae bacterium]|nr:hypothetical protein [Planctomycetaceae bacterium]
LVLKVQRSVKGKTQTQMVTIGK